MGNENDSHSDPDKYVPLRQRSLWEQLFNPFKCAFSEHEEPIGALACIMGSQYSNSNLDVCYFLAVHADYPAKCWDESHRVSGDEFPDYTNLPPNQIWEYVELVSFCPRCESILSTQRVFNPHYEAELTALKKKCAARFKSAQDRVDAWMRIQQSGEI